jgi:putative ABC transport system permease protein
MLALRQLRRTPALSIAAILCFALGIGANTSIFSVVDAVMFRPLPFPNADRLVLVGEALPRFGAANFGVISAPEFVDYQRLDGRVFAASAIYEPATYGISGTGEAERVTGLKASSTILRVLGVHAVHGRDLDASDDRIGSPDVVMIGDVLWRRRYAADPGIIGKPIDVDGRSYAVAGVLPPDFRFPLAGIGGEPADIIVPYRITADVERERANNYSTYLIARLADGVSMATARRAVAGLASQLSTLHPEIYGKTWVTLADAFPLRDQSTDKVRAPMIVLLAAVGFVLLIACINVSSLLLARAAARQREISIRQALGASRGRLVRQFLSESLVLVGIGSVLGVGSALWCTRLVARYAPDALLQGYDVSLDGRVLAVTGMIAVLTAVAFSLLPALQASSISLGATLRDADRSSTGGAAHQRGRRVLVISEIALALVLATGASLMIRSLGRAGAVNPGFDPQHVLGFRLQLPEFRYQTPGSVSQFERRFSESLAALPGAGIVSATTHLPMTGPSRIAFAIEGATQSKIPFASAELVMPHYFDAMRIPVHSGRAFAASDDEHSAPVAMINETLARQFFPKANPVGKRLKWGSAASPDPWATIVGVTADVHTDGVDQPELPAIYFPVAQHDTGRGMSATMVRGLTYLIRTDGEPSALMNAVRRTVRAADPELPVISLQPMTNVVSTSMSSRRFNTVLLTTFSLLALALAAAGIYGLMAYAVVQRTREIGIRLAIGARPADVLRLVVGQAARIATVGVCVGVVGALLLTRLMAALLFEVSPFDPLAFAASALLLLGVATVASYLPARRAAAIDPQTAIRIE